MKLTLKYSLILLILLFRLPVLLAQGFNGHNHQHPHIEAFFTRENIEIEASASLFNVLVIHNKGDRREEIFLEVNVPMGWTAVAYETRSHLIYPGDTLFLPVRVAPSRDVAGEIGYSIIAAINNRAGETLTNAYCFVKIPRETNFQFRPITRMGYFDQTNNTSMISFRMVNRGNVNELVYLNFTSTNAITLQNERDNMLSVDLMIRSKSDTIINIPVTLNEEFGISNGGTLRADVRGFTQDTEFTTSFWFTRLDSRYRFRIPESEKMLVAEIAVQNLLTDQEVGFAGGVKGAVLFENNHDINYNFYKFSTGGWDEILKYSRMKLEYNTPVFRLLLGDVSSLPVKYGLGKGAEASVLLKNHFRFTVVGSENQFRPIYNAGFIFEENKTRYRFQTRYAYTQNDFTRVRAHAMGVRSNLTINRFHSMRLEGSFSDAVFNQSGSNYQGFSLGVNYSGRIGKTTISLREQFGTVDFYGPFSGRHQFQGLIQHPLPQDYSLQVSLTDFQYKPVIETPLGLSSNLFQEQRRAEVRVRKVADRNLVYNGGPIFERKSSNSFGLYDGQNPFTTYSAKLGFGARISDRPNSFFAPHASFGYTFITDFSYPEASNIGFNVQGRSTSLFNAHVSMNMRRDFWGAYLNYFYGPYSINQEISQFYYNIMAHSVRVMPYWEKFIYRDIIRLNAKAGFLYDFAFKTSRLNLNNQMDIFLRNDFRINLLHTFSYQVTTDLITEENYTYSNNYFEIRAIKEFNWNQPRIKYHNLEINLFKDLNGNLRREFNEPGVKDILVHITSIDPLRYDQYDVDYLPPTTMVSKRLLTGMDGVIRYENLPRGLYKIELENIGRDTDKFFPDQNEFIINVAGDKTVYVPYLERNRIFGRVILNRSRLSALGRIEAGNIKVTATDSKGRPTSTLTDNNGNFEMYVPSVDSYIVTVNNIFRDHFNLRQNDFRANLNGFKQFEVNFVFDEIRRQIEFTPSFTEIETEIRRVGRTNLSGTVRDASTLQPIRATVEVIDNRNGNTILQTVTERNTGRYTATFVTGEDYILVVSANGYWLNSERLILDQFLTIQDAQRDILLESIAIGARFQLGNLRFAPGLSEIPTEAYPELDRLISQLRENPNVRIRIEGHSDAQETLNNPNISAQRAETVMRYMVNNGFSNIEFTGLRDSQPVAPSDTEENRRRNRRVEIVVVDR
ncbi:MAG: OmpA family protein [Bacteroidales bacterium]